MLARTILTLALVVLVAPAAQAADGWSWPLHGEVISVYRNGPDPYAGGQHRGIDIAGRVGDPVTSATAGTVHFAGSAGSSGLTVTVRTADGRYDSSYLHLSSLAVRAGDHLSRGNRIGSVGTSGRPSSSRPHLHFGVRDAGSRHAYHDPLDFLPAPGGPAPEAPVGAPPAVGAHRPVSPVAPPRPAAPRVRLPVARRRPSPRPVAAPPPVPLPSPLGRPERLPSPLGRPERLPSPLRRPAPLRSPLAGPARAPLPAAHPRPGPAHAAGGAPSASLALGAPPAGQPAQRAAVDARRGRAEAAGSSGPDLGWALACLGLLLAAALAGAAPAGREAGARARSRLLAVVRPLAG